MDDGPEVQIVAHFISFKLKVADCFFIFVVFTITQEFEILFNQIEESVSDSEAQMMAINLLSYSWVSYIELAERSTSQDLKRL